MRVKSWKFIKLKVACGEIGVVMPLTGWKIIDGIEVGIGIVGEETGARYVASRFIDDNAVGLQNVIGNGSEEVAVRRGVVLDGYYPFEAVAGRAAKKQLRVEIVIV